MKLEEIESIVARTKLKENKNKAFYEVLTKTERAKVVSAIKSLNQRMTDLEEHNMTGTSAYNNLKSFTASMNNHDYGTYLNNKGVKETAIRSKQTYKVTAEQFKRLFAIKNNPNASRGGEIKKVEELFRKNDRDISKKEAEKFAAGYGDLHEFINDHKDAYYGSAGNPSTLEKAVQRSSNLTLDEVEQFYELMADVEGAVERNKTEWNSYLDQPKVSE